jgi:hypothetical protein
MDTAGGVSSCHFAPMKELTSTPLQQLQPPDLFLLALRIIIFLHEIQLPQVLKPKQDLQTTSSLILDETIRKCNLGKSLQCFCFLLECLGEDLEIGDAHIGAGPNRVP